MVELFKELNRLNIGDKKLTIGDKYIWRPISHLILVPIISMGGRNPNIITLISILSLLFGIWVDNYWILFFMCWAILDCADGSLARYNLRDKITYGNGELIDAIGGYLFIVSFWYKMFLVYHHDLAIIALIMNLLARVIFLKYTLTHRSRVEKNMTRKNRLYHIYENIEFGSLMLIIFLIFKISNVAFYFTFFYALLSVMLVVYSMYQSFRDFNVKYKI